MTDDQRKAFVRAMLRIVDGVLSGELEPGHAAKRLEQGAKWCQKAARPVEEGAKAPVESASLGPSMDEVRAVFEHWREASGRPRAKLDSHKDVIRRALKTFSVDDLKSVASWARHDDWFQGLSDGGDRRDWPGYMYRSAKRIEELLERANKAGIGEGAAVIEFDKARRFRELEAAAEEALREDRTDEYNELQKQLRNLEG